MTIFEIIILAFALAIDAMIVSFSYGLIINAKKLKNSLLLASAFGFFQFMMPVIGYFLSSFVYNQLKMFSKWIVFSIFLYLAIRFLKSALTKKEETCISCISVFCLLSMALATSIDALGAGISIKFNNDLILRPSLYIGIITFIFSFIGFWSACLLKKFPQKYIEIVGAILLLYLAISAIF